MKRVFYPLVKWAARYSLLMTVLVAARRNVEIMGASEISHARMVWLWQHPFEALQIYWLSWIIGLALILAFVGGTAMLFALRAGEGPAAKLSEVYGQVIDTPALFFPAAAYAAWAVLALQSIGEYTPLPSAIAAMLFLAFWIATWR